MAMLLQRVAGGYSPTSRSGPRAMSGQEALWMATSGGAEVLGRDDVGQLAPGKAADAVGLRLDRLDYAGALHDPLAPLVFCHPQRVDLSIVNGEVVIQEGRLITLDIEPVIERHNRISQRLVRREEGAALTRVGGSPRRDS